MKVKGQKIGPPPVPPSSPGPPISKSLRAAVWLGAVVLAAMVYRPALHGAFVFDDLALPFQLTIAETSLRSWLDGTRPVLMFSYWLNFSLSGAANPFSYHLLNVLIHAVNTVLVFGILAWVLDAAGWAKERVRI